MVCMRVLTTSNGLTTRAAVEPAMHPDMNDHLRIKGRDLNCEYEIRKKNKTRLEETWRKIKKIKNNNNFRSHNIEISVHICDDILDAYNFNKRLSKELITTHFLAKKGRFELKLHLHNIVH